MHLLSEDVSGTNFGLEMVLDQILLYPVSMFEEFGGCSGSQGF